MMASSLRVADVFDRYTNTWRTVLLAGRGAGGKSLTALDVTYPGPATRSALGAINPPLVLWNRGNPDTVNGKLGGTKVNGDGDYNAYLKMGETWSTPAIVRVMAADNPTTREPVSVSPTVSGGVEFAAYAGSGYSSVSSEGTTFYSLDVLTGDVIGSHTVTARSEPPTLDGVAIPNALVAPPSVMLPAMYSTSVFINPSDALAHRVYIGDVHGRVWAFPPKGGTNFKPLGSSTGDVPFADLGKNQPIGNGVSLLWYSSETGMDKMGHVYTATGNDARVAPPGDAPPFNKTPPFYMFGLRDEDRTADPDGSDAVGGVARLLFNKPFPNDPPPGFRGTVQPSVVFNTNHQGRVFFAGTQFTPAGLECMSSLDSIIYALTGLKGEAAYDLNLGDEDEYYLLPDQIVLALDVVRIPPESGRLNISKAVADEQAERRRELPDRVRARGQQVLLGRGRLPAGDGHAAADEHRRASGTRRRVRDGNEAQLGGLPAVSLEPRQPGRSRAVEAFLSSRAGVR